MHKKGLILVSVILFTLCIFSSFVCATDNVKNAVSNVTDTVIDGTANLAEDVRSGVGNLENGVEDALNMNHTNTTDGTATHTNTTDGVAKTTDGYTTTNDGYTATRTTADATTTAAGTTRTSTLWIWLVVAIAAIVIIGLVWYYGAQNNTHRGE